MKCPNICKECQSQCQKFQEISNLEGHGLMKFIKTQQEIAGNQTGSLRSRTDFPDTDVTSSTGPSPPRRKEYLEAKMTSCCVTCDTILQQISILLGEIWDILEPRRKVCNVCQIAKHEKCNCQQTDTDSLQAYSPRFNVLSTKEGFLSWLTKLRHILLKVLEGVTRSRCMIYKGEPKGELEKLLQELKAPLQKQARDIRITSLTKFPLSSTERDESLVASLIENTELLERVLTKIKAEGRKIEMKIYTDQRFQAQSKTSRLPELKVISVQPFTSSASSFTNTMFPPIPGKIKTDRDEFKSGASHVKDDKSEQDKRNAPKRLDLVKSPYEKSLIKSRKDILSIEKPDYIISARKKDRSPDVHRKIPSDNSKYKTKERQTQSAITRHKIQTDGVEKSKSSKLPTETSTRKSLKHSVSFPGMLNETKTKGMKEYAEVKPSNIADTSIEDLKKARAKASQQHIDTKYRGKRRMEAELSPGDKIKSKERTKDEEDQKSPQQKSIIKEKIMKHRKTIIKPDPTPEGKFKSKDKPIDKNDRKSSQIKSGIEEQIARHPKQSPREKNKSKGRIKDEDAKSLQSKSTTEGKNSTQDKRDEDLVPRFKKQGKIKDKELESMSILENVKIKEGGKGKSILQWKSIDKNGDIGKDNIKKRKFKKSSSEEKLVDLPYYDRATYTRRQTIQIPSKLILKRMHDHKVEEMRMKRRAERMKDKPLKKIKSLKSLPNLEMLKQKLKKQKREESVIEFLESDISECASTPQPLEMIRGKRVMPFASAPKQEYVDDHEPLLFKVQADLADDAFLVQDKARYESAITLKAQKSLAGKGVIDYKLSNPKYIELGYTKLPTLAVMGTSIVHKMEQPRPEEDWFKRHKRERCLYYDTGEKLAEIDEDGHGRWYYKNGRMALNYCAAEGKDARNRYIVYSSGENDASGHPRCDTILASFDHLGNGIVYDHCGSVRLKYNQNEGENFDKTICPLGRWKWHSLNTTLSALHNVYVEQRVKLFHKFELDMFEDISDTGNNVSKQFEETAGDVAEEHKTMLTIEMSNLFKEKKQMLLQKYQPFQLKMKALRLNEQFTLRIYEQRKVYLYFNAGTRTLKLNLGLILIPTEVLGTETVNLRDIMTPYDQIIPQSDSVANILDIVSETRRKMRKKGSFHQNFYSGIRKTSSPVGIIR